MQNRQKNFTYRKTSKSRDKIVRTHNVKTHNKKNIRLIKYFFCGFISMFFISMLFYKSFIICFLISVVYGKLNIRNEVKKDNELWKWKLNLEFKEMLLGMSAALSAGYSIENSIRESKKDLELLYGEKSVILPEVNKMIFEIENRKPVEKAISDFAIHCNVEDIRCFSEIFNIARRTGGNMVEIVKATADRISSKIEVNREIKTMIAAKKLESKIMNFVPLFIIIYFGITSPGFLDCLYTESGHVFMTFIFAIYILGCILGRKVSDINI